LSSQWMVRSSIAVTAYRPLVVSRIITTYFGQGRIIQYPTILVK
jgi:hypothetical protein